MRKKELNDKIIPTLFAFKSDKIGWLKDRYWMMKREGVRDSLF